MGTTFNKCPNCNRSVAGLLSTIYIYECKNAAHIFATSVVAIGAPIVAQKIKERLDM